MIRVTQEMAKVVDALLQIGFINGRRNTHLIQVLIAGDLVDRRGFGDGRIFYVDDTLRWSGSDSRYFFCGMLEDAKTRFVVENIKLTTCASANGWVWCIEYIYRLENGISSAYNCMYIPVRPGLWISDEPDLDIEEE